MSLIDKKKTVEAIATYLFVNDAIRGPEPRRVADYLVFAESMLKDVPDLNVVRCKECKYWCKGDEVYGICNRCANTRQMRYDDFCSYGEVRDE